MCVYIYIYIYIYICICIWIYVYIYIYIYMCAQTSTTSTAAATATTTTSTSTSSHLRSAGSRSAVRRTVLPLTIRLLPSTDTSPSKRRCTESCFSRYARYSASSRSFTATTSGEVKTRTNRSGGIQGGISNGEPIWFRVGFKPTSTILKTQDSVNQSRQEVQFSGTGRHDPCVLPRAVAVVESMLALVLADRMLARNATPPSKE